MYFQRYYPGWEFGWEVTLFGRTFAVLLSTADGYYSVYTYRAQDEEDDEWVGFLGLTKSPERGWHIQR